MNQIEIKDEKMDDQVCINEVDMHQKDEMQMEMHEQECLELIQNNSCCIFPKFLTCDYSSIEKIKETFYPMRRLNNIEDSFKTDESVFMFVHSNNMDHLHKAMKYGYWTSTKGVNNEVSLQFKRMQRDTSQKTYLCFILARKILVGVAELVSDFSLKKSFLLWNEIGSWFGVFQVEWLLVGKVQFDCERIQFPNIPYEKGMSIVDSLKNITPFRVFKNFESMDRMEEGLRSNCLQDPNILYKFIEYHKAEENKYNYCRLSNSYTQKVWSSPLRRKTNTSQYKQQPQSEYVKKNNYNSDSSYNERKNNMFPSSQQQKSSRNYSDNPYLSQNQNNPIAINNFDEEVIPSYLHDIEDTQDFSELVRCRTKIILNIKRYKDQIFEESPPQNKEKTRKVLKLRQFRTADLEDLPILQQQQDINTNFSSLNQNQINQIMDDYFQLHQLSNYQDNMSQ